jgi:alcohol dehydrogenase (cytochrome c)
MYTGGWPKSEVPASSAHMPINTRVAGGYGAVSALDARTGALRWQFKLDNVPEAGILTTASNLLFAGSRDGIFYALDARNGAPLWKMNLGANLWSGAVTFRTRGRQYVTVTAGASLYTFTLR